MWWIAARTRLFRQPGAGVNFRRFPGGIPSTVTGRDQGAGPKTANSVASHITVKAVVLSNKNFRKLIAQEKKIFNKDVLLDFIESWLIQIEQNNNNIERRIDALTKSFAGNLERVDNKIVLLKSEIRTIECQIIAGQLEIDGKITKKDRKKFAEDCNQFHPRKFDRQKDIDKFKGSIWSDLVSDFQTTHKRYFEHFKAKTYRFSYIHSNTRNSKLDSDDMQTWQRVALEAWELLKEKALSKDYSEKILVSSGAITDYQEESRQFEYTPKRIKVLYIAAEDLSGRISYIVGIGAEFALKGNPFVGSAAPELPTEELAFGCTVGMIKTMFELKFPLKVVSKECGLAP
ncbi:MAG: hypothetical protein IIA14_07805 [SAR324 cluster bacterium]|nr:hypothetical protein [SAR324 cluster bacterium]